MDEQTADSTVQRPFRTRLRAALAASRVIFTSPAAVHHAAALVALRTRSTVLAVGQGLFLPVEALGNARMEYSPRPRNRR